VRRTSGNPPGASGAGDTNAPAASQLAGLGALPGQSDTVLPLVFPFRGKPRTSRLRTGRVCRGIHTLFSWLLACRLRMCGLGV
jgi:hypothetical protein